MMKILRIRLMVIGFVVLVALAAALFSQRVKIKETLQTLDQPDLPEAVSYQEVSQQQNDSNPEVSIDPIFVDAEGEGEQVVDETESEPGDEEGADPETSEPQDLSDEDGLPARINLAVPFTSQAPHANWDLPYQEACEEASMYMVHAFYSGTSAGKIPAATADAELLKIVEFENEFIGDYLDTTAQQTADIIESFYGYGRVDLIFDPTIEDIKKNITAGRPVIVPAAGRDLGNPFFTPPGPVYHMLVVRGYTETGFITNDPGTYRGEEFFYKYDQLMSAIGDWNNGDPANGQKVVLVIWPE